MENHLLSIHGGGLVINYLDCNKSVRCELCVNSKDQSHLVGHNFWRTNHDRHTLYS